MNYFSPLRAKKSCVGLMRTVYDNAEAQAVVAIDRSAVATIRTSTVTRTAEPTATPEDAGRARRHTGWILPTARCTIIIPIPAPLPYITARACK